MPARSATRTLRLAGNSGRRNGQVIGGISNGAFLLAASGLLNQHSATTHWEDFESFCLLFPEVHARYQRFVIDRNRISCAGGSATLDLFLELARQDLGNEVALKISRQMLLQEQSIVLPGSTSRTPGRQYSPPVQRALSLIEAGVGPVDQRLATGATHRYQPARPVTPVSQGIEQHSIACSQPAPARSRALVDTQHRLTDDHHRRIGGFQLTITPHHQLSCRVRHHPCAAASRVQGGQPPPASEEPRLSRLVTRPIRKFCDFDGEIQLTKISHLRGLANYYYWWNMLTLGNSKLSSTNTSYLF